MKVIRPSIRIFITLDCFFIILIFLYFKHLHKIIEEKLQEFYQ